MPTPGVPDRTRMFARVLGPFILIVAGVAVLRAPHLTTLLEQFTDFRFDVRYESSSATERPTAVAPAATGGTLDDDRTGNFMAPKGGGVLEGVTPVPLPLPSYQHSMWSSRELVTKERPFHPTLWYITDMVVLPISLLWLLGFGIVIGGHRARLMDGFRRLRARVEAAPLESAPPSVPDNEQQKGSS